MVDGVSMMSIKQFTIDAVTAGYKFRESLRYWYTCY